METANYLKSFFTEHWKYMAISTACKLGVFDALDKNKKKCRELVEELKLDEKALSFLLNALYQVNFLNRAGEDYSLNEVSKLLTENHPESLKYACLNWSSEHLNAWQNLDFVIKTGASSFEKIYGKSFFDYLNEHPEKLHYYHKAMFEYARDDYKWLPNTIDFSKHQSIIDIGGGYGAAISAIKSKFKKISCSLFDLPNVIANVSIDNVQKLAGNFFVEIPKVAEAMILSRVLHDWNEPKAELILENCFLALPEKGILYIIENCHQGINEDLSLLSLNMLSMCQSYERSASEYINLCEKIKFVYQSQVQLNKLQTILIFQKPS